jgi:hypothetical protein
VTRLARAFESNRDFWFIEIYTLGDVQLPEGVSISTSDPQGEPRGYILLENQTETLLFVLSLGYKDVLVMETPDPNWKDRVNGAHEVASYLVVPDRPAVLDMQALSDLDHTLRDINVVDDAPPDEDTPVPEPQISELLLVYGDQVLEVPFVISYALIPLYDTGVQANQESIASAESTIDTGIKPTEQVQDVEAGAGRGISLGIGLLLLAGAIILGWASWKAFKRQNQ